MTSRSRAPAEIALANGPKRPSALVWLIRKHARLQGTLTQLEGDIAALRLRLPKLREQLKHIERVIALHELKVEPAAIEPVTPQRVKRLLPYGALTRQILTCLRKATQPVSTPVIVAWLCESNGWTFTDAQRVEFTVCVKKRLQAEVGRGLVRRCHKRKTSRYGSWELASHRG